MFFLFLGTCWLFYKLTHLEPATTWIEANSDNTSKVKLPWDDAPHKVKIEWWYYNGHLTTESDKQYSFHDTVFLINNLTSHMVSHVSLTNHETGEHFTVQRRTGGNPSVNTKNGFDFNQGNWIMKGTNGHDKLKVTTRHFNFDLSLTSSLPPVFHGLDGIISLASAGESYYYSRTRMGISGTITTNGITEKVTGISWFDHQWGDFLVGQLSWDWFSLQLDDGKDVMIYQLRDKSYNSILYMASIRQNDSTEMLSGAEFKLMPGKIWHSTKTGANYPLEWKIDIPGKNIDITTRAIVNNSEFDARLTTYNVYWEGAIEIQGTHQGRGFMELSGYSTNIPDDS